MHNLVNIIQPQVKAKQLELFIDTFEVVGSESNDCVHWRADIMGHIGQEGGFCPIGMLRLHQCVLQSLSLLFLFF